MSGKGVTRRQFVRRTVVLAGTTLLSSCKTGPFAKAHKQTAVDQVPLGKTGLKLSRLGIGTGTLGGSVQRALGREDFNRLIRYAYEQGITYIDTAENYKTHTMVRDAIKGLPREKLFIQSKMPRVPEKPLEVLDRYRSELGVDYIDSLLVHAARRPDWDQERQRLLDAFEEAKSRQLIRAHGVSCHSLSALTKAAELDWVDVNLVRVNPQGVNIDTANAGRRVRSDSSHVPLVLRQIKLMRENQHGVIGMKILGEGNFTNPEDREKSVRFTLQAGLVDAVVIGFKNTAEIDEAIMRINTALAEIA
jgi:predicted aldo/keto reductase-like oxidoreductase